MSAKTAPAAIGWGIWYFIARSFSGACQATMRTSFKTRFGLAPLIGCCVLILSCAQGVLRKDPSLVPVGKTYFMEVRDADSVTIGWNPPPTDSFTVNNYELYYRSLRDTNWTLLDSNLSPMANPVVTIRRDSIKSSDSLFYFGVRCVTTEGGKSDLSSCADSLSIPSGGWFLFWKRPVKN
jgi:hypothetical protein